jgi:hypothetical protein
LNETALLRDGKHRKLTFSLHGHLERSYPFTMYPVLLEYLQIWFYSPHTLQHIVWLVDCVFCIIFCTVSILHVLPLYMIWYIKLSNIYLANVTCLSLTYRHFYRAMTVQKHELRFTRICIVDQSQFKGFVHRIDFNFDRMVRTQGTFGIYNVFQTQWKFL